VSALPRLVVVDDVYGRPPAPRNRDREDLCHTAGLADVTGDGPAEPIRDPVAEAVFLRGQRESGGAVVNDLDGTLAEIRQGWSAEIRWSLLLLDLHFKTGPVTASGEPAGSDSDWSPGRYFGLALLERLWADTELRELPVAILSSMEREKIERQFTERGVWDFVEKRALTRDRLDLLLCTHGLIEDTDGVIIGRSLAMLKCLREARRRAMHPGDNMLVLGERGSGKELLGVYIHRHSRRRGPYVPLNLLGVPESLVEDLLFGHVKGAFTGAADDKPGAAEQADGGTLFVDEFGRVPAAVQDRLLRLLDRNTRETRRIGADRPKRIDVEVVLATNRLDILTSDDFQRDVLDRAKVTNPIVVPPLRERHGDIPLLAQAFIRRSEELLRKQGRHVQTRELTPEALSALVAYSYPGNVRELEGMMEHAVSTWPGMRLLAQQHLIFDTQGQSSGEDAAVATASRLRSADATTAPAQGGRPDLQPVGLDAVVAALEAARPELLTAEQLAGALPRLQAAYARLVARFVRAALLATRKRSARLPAGELQVQTAMQLLSGDPALRMAGPRRLLHRLLTIMPDAIRDLLLDPVLEAAQQRAGTLKRKGQADRQ
jgi:transcriptional regulator with GAF, ATPase, and Fis domain